MASGGGKFSSEHEGVRSRARRSIRNFHDWELSPLGVLGEIQGQPWRAPIPRLGESTPLISIIGTALCPVPPQYLELVWAGGHCPQWGLG
ncbi:hypothetical protein SK128_010904, partial [Halocaridina rubra]